MLTIEVFQYHDEEDHRQSRERERETEGRDGRRGVMICTYTSMKALSFSGRSIST